ncbi:hypothetical protein [Acaryochloris marina]|nr:hypothetical protein [Acaryochloris marina]
MPSVITTQLCLPWLAVDPDCPAEVHQVRHEFWLEYFLEPDSDCICFIKCTADIEGSFAVTYLEL